MSLQSDSTHIYHISRCTHVERACKYPYMILTNIIVQTAYKIINDTGKRTGKVAMHNKYHKFLLNGINTIILYITYLYTSATCNNYSDGRVENLQLKHRLHSGPVLSKLRHSTFPATDMEILTQGVTWKACKKKKKTHTHTKKNAW